MNDAADCWPTPLQELLLEAGLATGVAGARALSALEARFAQGELPPAAERLMPLVFRAVREAGIEAPALTRHGEAAYVRSWQRSEQASPRVAAALVALADAAIPSLVLKGWALGGVYGDPALRPASDLDLLVPAARFAEAAAALRAAGSRPLGTGLEPIAHAQAFTSPGLDVDLHRHALEEFVGTRHEAALWAEASPFELAGEPTRALSAVDQFLLVCVHGLRWVPEAAVHWIADAVLLLRAQGESFDWERLAARAEVFDVALPLRAGLRYLDGRFGVEVPAPVQRRLERATASWPRRRAFAARQLAPQRRGVLDAWAVRHEFRRRRQIVAPAGRVEGRHPLRRLAEARRALAGAWRALRVSLARRS